MTLEERALAALTKSENNVRRSDIRAFGEACREVGLDVDPTTLEPFVVEGMRVSPRYLYGSDSVWSGSVEVKDTYLRFEFTRIVYSLADIGAMFRRRNEAARWRRKS